MKHISSCTCVVDVRSWNTGSWIPAYLAFPRFSTFLVRFFVLFTVSCNKLTSVSYQPVTVIVVAIVAVVLWNERLNF